MWERTASPTPQVLRRKPVLLITAILIILGPLLLHFSSVLGPAWQVMLFTSLDRDIDATSPSVKRAIDAGGIEVRYAPTELHFTRKKIAQFLTLPWLWEQLAPAEHVLMFQTDSIICANSPISVEDYLHYDFVRVPMDLPGGEFDGGLSLQNRSMTLQITMESDWTADVAAASDANSKDVGLADRWLVAKIKQMGARFPAKEITMMFSVGRIWHNSPLSYHRVDRWRPDKMEKVDKWCPEHRLFTSPPLPEEETRGSTTTPSRS